MSLTDLIPILEPAIGPVILISGIGLVLLSMTNRFGRIIDRSRILSRELKEASGLDRDQIVAELRILSRRERMVRSGIALAILSLLLTALLVIGLFLGALLKLAIATALVVVFMVCMFCLVLSLLFFFADINLSLKALWIEIPPEARG